MANLVNRKPLNTTVENTLRDLFDTLSEQTRIPKSRLLDEALEDLFKKYGIEYVKLGLDKVQGEA